MFNLYIGDWVAEIEYSPSVLGYLLYLYQDRADGRHFLTENGKTIVVKPTDDPVFKQDVYFARLQKEQLRAIATTASRQGIISKDDSYLKGQLEATKCHLNDMRSIVFKNQVPPKLAQNETDEGV